MFDRLLRQCHFLLETFVPSEHAVLRIGELQKEEGTLPGLFVLRIKCLEGSIRGLRETFVHLDGSLVCRWRSRHPHCCSD